MAEWRDRMGRAAVLLASAAAVLSVLVGIGGIFAVGPRLPIGGYIPEAVTVVAGFTGTLTGFLLLAVTYALRKGYRAGWYAALVLLPVTAAQGLAAGTYPSVLLAVLSLLAIAALVRSRRLFTAEFDLTATQLAALAALVGSLSYGTAGTYALREKFPTVSTPLDALYFTVVTASTVGYGDVTPDPASPLARLFVISSLVLNVVSFAVALGVIFTPAIEARLTNALGRMTDSNLDILERHILVLGHGELTEPLVEELTAADVGFLLVTPDEAVARSLRDRDVDVLTADPSDEETLARAKVAEARAVVAATNDDAQDALAILTARQLNPDVTIVAAATERENVNKLKRAGANTVISPASIGGHLLVESALEKGDSEAVAREILDDERGDETAGAESDRDGRPAE